MVADVTNSPNRKIYMRTAELIARRQYGQVPDELALKRLAEAYTDDVPVEQAVHELYGTPPEDD